MGRRRKFYEKIVSGQSDNNIPFDRTCVLLEHLGFNARISGDHHIFEKPGIEDPINIQPTRESKVKPYQVKQIRKVLLDYNLEP
jgi:hypothetical protein